MKGQFICHPDFEALEPLQIFHKEYVKFDMPAHPAELQNRHILFRRKAELKPAEKAILRISADDYYKLYINGKFVTMGPASGYPFRYNYNEVDVTAYLTAGVNTFAVHSYYQGLNNRVWVSGDQRAMFWCELDLDGETVLVSDESWVCHDHTAYTTNGTWGYQTAFYEIYDSAAPEVGFEQPDFDDKNWIKASVRKYADWKLAKQMTGQLDIYTVKPVTVKKIDGGLFMDFGQQMVGYSWAKAHGNKGDQVVFHCGEELNEDGSVRWDCRCSCTFEDSWILSGGEDVLDQFDFKSYRFMEVLFPDTVTIDDVGMIVRHRPFRLAAKYDTDNADLKKILDLCFRTIKYGSQECFVDCPAREKAEYMGDLTISGRASAVITGDTTFMKKAIQNFCDSAFVCPGLLAVSVAARMQEIADYSLQFPAQIVWVHSMDGDTEFTRRTEPAVTGLYKYFVGYAEQNPDGLLEHFTDKWNLVDWPASMRDGYDFPMTEPIGPGVHNVLNAFWCGFLDAMAEFYTILGMTDEAAEAAARAKSVKAAFIKTFYNPETGYFCDSAAKTHSAVQSNLLPLLFNIGTEDEALRRRLIDMIRVKRLSSMGVYMAYFALAALVLNGERELAVELATDPDCWMHMFEQDATATMEVWDKEQKGNTSFFHPWACAPAIVFAENVRAY